MALKLGLSYWVQKCYHNRSNDDLRLTLTFFKVKDRKMPFHMISWKILEILARKLVYSVVLMSS